MHNHHFAGVGSLLLIGAALAAPLRAQPATVGQLVNVAGRVEIRRGSGAALRGSLLFPLQAGDVVSVATGGTGQVVLFQTGVRVALPGGSSARITAAALAPLSGPAPQPLGKLSPLFARRMNVPRKPVSAGIMGMLVRSVEDETLGPRRPSPDGAVRTLPVTLRWAGPIEGDQLRLQVTCGERLIHRADLEPAVREYRVPDGVLKPGVEYTWSITAYQGGDLGTRACATLRALRPEERSEVEGMEQETETACHASPDDPAPLLFLGRGYEALRMNAEAIAIYQRVLRMRPADAGVEAAVKRLQSGGE